MRFLFCFVVLLATSAEAAEHEFKIATLAPEGSTWWKVLKEADKRLDDLSGGRVRFKIYAGGVAGDEPVAVRKMRLGQLQGAGMTSVGLAEIQPALLALQAPGLYQNWKELDDVRNHLSEQFKSLLGEKGFVVLTWVDVGFNRMFTNVRITKPEDMKALKPWCWTQDGVYRAYYAKAGANAVLVGVPEVLPGLQTGLIDSFSAPPLVAVSMQWFSRAKFMLDVPQNATIGAIVLKKSAVDKLSAADQLILTQVGRELGDKLAAAVRADNEASMEAIRKAGITVVTADVAAKQAWQALGEQSSDQAAADGVYPKALLQEIRRVVRGLRVAVK